MSVKPDYPGREVTARLWRCDVGRTELFICSTPTTNVNLHEDRTITLSPLRRRLGEPSQAGDSFRHGRYQGLERDGHKVPMSTTATRVMPRS